VHPSAYAEMARCVETYMPKGRRSVVVDFGSYTSVQRQGMTHRQLLADHDCEIVGVDIRPGLNVDRVMEKPYRLPMRTSSVDVVLSGQVFEHIPFFWASMLEIARVLKTGGHFFMTAPSRGHQHTPVDCWRYYPDGVRAMAAFSGLEVVEVRTDFPPKVGDVPPGSVPPGVRPGHHDFAAIDMEHRYWGDTVAVFRKPESYPARRLALVRPPLLWWANRTADAALPPRARKRQ
jgi:SAM-dependent methyltransferase